MNIGIAPTQYNLLDIAKLLSGAHSKITYQWSGYFNNLSTELISNLSDNGYIFPSQNTEKLTVLAPTFKKSIVFNSDEVKMQLNNAGIYENIATESSLTTTAILGRIASDVGKIFHDTTEDRLVVSFDGVSLREITTTAVA